MDGHIKDPTQEQRILAILKEAQQDLNGGWVNGMVFLNLIPRPITQYHARIWGLQQRGYNIEGRFISDKTWKEYRLVSNPEPLKLFQQHEQLQHSGS